MDFPNFKLTRDEADSRQRMAELVTKRNEQKFHELSAKDKKELQMIHSYLTRLYGYKS